MTLKKDIEKMCTDIDVEIISVLQDCVEINVPYEIGEVVIGLEGETNEEKIESFKLGVNEVLQRMIDHLERCKL